ncbi:hypothetical protein [Ruminococcus bromii]|uniref:hypothetical protein n=1 Tax=Oscillospiraceae TaxID=216572 RepID=UPI0025FCE206|nr:hypothetical protein [Ruminococcus bromii]MDE8728018.1 hypothetical protein [Ruminococcus bromii]
MTKEEVYQYYLQWKRGEKTWTMNEILNTPITNVNIFENEQMLTNRLFYVVTDFYENKLRVLIFYEENVFLKEKNDELMLVQDIWGIQ